MAPGDALTKGDADNVYTAASRVLPLPTGPWSDFGAAYRDSKVLALNATERFKTDKSPHFSIVNIMPGYVIGANELVTDVNEIANGSNGVVMAIITGLQAPSARPLSLIGLSDVVRAHVGSLDEEKIQGNKDFVLDSCRPSFDEVNDIVRKALPEAVKNGSITLGGSMPAAYLRYNVDETTRVFGPLASYESDVVSVAKQFLQLSQAST